MSRASEQRLEAAAMEQLENEGPIVPHSNEDLSMDMNITKMRPLPDGFENPPVGESNHRCVGNDGLYHPEWVQLMIESVYEGQANPQKFPLGGVTYMIQLDEWVDAPPCVLESLVSAVETHHRKTPPKPGDVALGIKAKHVKITRKRFVYHSMPSA